MFSTGYAKKKRRFVNITELQYEQRKVRIASWAARDVINNVKNWKLAKNWKIGMVH